MRTFEKLYIMSNLSFAPFCFKWKPIHVFWLLLVMVTAVLFLLITFTPGIVIARHRVIKSVREVVTESSAEPSEEPVISQTDMEMFWKQNRRHRMVSETTCSDIIAGNKSVISEQEEFMKKNSRPILSDHIYVNLTKNCTDFKLRRGYILETLSKESAEFPLAYSILFYKDLMQTERLLRAIYRPNNIYCLHMDAYSSDVLLKSAQALVSCFDNVFLSSKLVGVVYASYSRLQAEINCMEESLTKNTSWKYFINLASQAFPLKTNEELVKILKVYKGYNIVSSLYGDNINPKRFKYKVYYTKKDGRKPVLHKGRIRLHPPPPHHIKLLKGSAYGVFSRKMTEYVIHDKRSRDFLNWSRDTFTPDEHFWASLNSLKFNRHLLTPGGNRADPHKTLSVATYVDWNRESCKSGKFVREICIFGIRDLPAMTSSQYLFANKFYLDYQYLAMDCLEELLWNRTWAKTSINTKYYEKIANLQIKG